MTHPFHPLLGQEFEVVDYGSPWGEARVYFNGPGGGLTQLPAAWTDFVEPDPFVVVAAGRSPLHARALLRLADLVQQLREGEGGRGCKANNAGSVKRTTPGRSPGCGTERNKECFK